MKIEAQEFLDLVERTHTIVFFDIEATGLRGDYNGVLVVSVKPFGRSPITAFVARPGMDRSVVLMAKDQLEQAGCWVSYYGKMFDVPMLNTRLLRWGFPPIQKRPHLDLYFTLKAHLLTSRRSQSHLLSWLRTPQQKMSVSAETWNQILAEPRKHLPEMIKRCESDTRGLEALYRKTRHLVTEVNR